jgi:hypothetical protein
VGTGLHFGFFIFIFLFFWLSRALAEAGMAWLRGTDKMGSWWAGTGRVRVKIVNNVHGHLRSHNLGKRIMRCSFLARRLVVCLERVTTATIKQFIRPSRPLFYMKERATRDNLALVAYDCSDDHL